MPLTRAQAEDFIQAFFRDHRLAAPPIGTRRRFMVTLGKRKRLNLPRVITRETLADQVAARLCRECVKRQAFHKRLDLAMAGCSFGSVQRPRLYRHFAEWRKYVRGVVVRHFGKGDGLA